MINKNELSKMRTLQNSHKEATLQLRISSKQKLLLSQAAKLRNMTLSGFVLERAFNAAQELLFDQVNFSLDESSWESFCQAIDAPSVLVANLNQLLNQKGLLDE